MPKDKLKHTQMRARIAAAAARLMAEDGIDDYALAKRKAARQLGASDTQALPGNEEVEAELAAYQSLYQEDEQSQRIQELRAIAYQAMQALEEYRPYLTGPVLRGTAGRYADIDLQLFTDDPKGPALYFLNRDIPFDVSEDRHYSGDEAFPVEVMHVEWDGVPLNLAIYSANDERRSLKSTLGGRPIERANLQAVADLVNAPPNGHGS